MPRSAFEDEKFRTDLYLEAEKMTPKRFWAPEKSEEEIGLLVGGAVLIVVATYAAIIGMGNMGIEGVILVVAAGVGGYFFRKSEIRTWRREVDRTYWEMKR